ncbi:MAG: V-type ATP synthase subunit I, partial [Candidatus Kariarchaeaceae archaeon]
EKKKSLRKRELFEKSEECLNIVEENVRNNIGKIKENVDKKNNNTYLISNLMHMPEIKTDLLKETEYTKKIEGIVATGSVELIKNYVKDKCIFFSREIDKKTALVIITCLHEDFSNVDGFLHEIGFDNISVPYENATPREIITKLKKENEDIANEEESIMKEQKQLYDSYYDMLAYFHEQLLIWKEKVDVLHLIKGGSSFSALEMWVPEKNIEALKDILDRRAEGYYFVNDEDMESPSLLKNPVWAKPFEGILGLYSLPKYKNFDPTPILAITFTFTFGFMLTDFVYGLLIFVMGILLLRGKGRYDEKTKGLGIIMTMFGFSTLVLGAVFGSYFGNFFQELGIKVPMLLDALGQVMLVLIISLAIGTLHMTIGLFVGFFENVRKKQALEGLHQQGVWIFFVFGLVFIVLQLMNIGFAFLAAAVVTQVTLTFKKDGLVPSILSIFGFTGFIGDLFSYGRLMAMAIGTTGIALAVNFMTIMAAEMIPGIGIGVAVIVFIIGHLFNMAMNGLGAFVHSTRLHFLEFFSKFFDGGGKKYIPFGTKE